MTLGPGKVPAPATATDVLPCKELARGPFSFCPANCILVPPMTTLGKDVWVFRIVHQDTGKPAQGVPVTVLDGAGNPAGYWVSEADGTVSVPRREGPRLRLRVGLRNEEPIELVTARLSEGPTDLAAPSWVPLASGGPERVIAAAAPRGAEPQEVPAHVLYFQRLAMFAERAVAGPAGARDASADFFAVASDQPAALRY